MRRPQVDPKTFRKHSRIVEKRQDQVVVAGDRIQTDFGFFIDGHKGKTFETKFMLIMPSSMTPKWLHDKKTRVIKVIGGVGHFQTFTKDGTVSTRPVTIGDEVTIEAGTTYRITSSPAKLEFYVIQDPKYESSLQELEPAETVAVVTPEDLESISVEDKAHQTAVVMGVNRSVRSNRAREQLAAQRGGRPTEARPRGTHEDTFFSQAPAAAGVNAMPVLAFDPDGAG